MIKSSLIRPSIIGLCRVALVCGIGSLALLSAGCGGNQAAAGQAGGPQGAMVTVAVAAGKDVPVYLDEIGRVVASESVTIQPQVSGKIMAKHFDDGADLHKGDLLFELDARPFEAVLAQAQAALAQAQAQYEFSQQDYKRVENLQGTSAVSQQDYDQKKNAMAVAAAVIKADEAAMQTAQLNLEYCRITSPIDGRAGSRLVDPGNVVNSGGQNGGTNLLVIQKLDPVYADFTVTENDLKDVQKYMAMGTLDVQVQLPQDKSPVAGGSLMAAPAPTSQPATVASAATTAPATGQLTFLDNAIQDGTGTIKLRATLPNPEHHFWPGQFVNIRLVLTIKKDAVLIPSQAVQIGQQGQFVYVVKPDSTAEQRPIITGQRQGDMVVIEQGLTASEPVILTGQQMVMPGGKVVDVAKMGPPPGAPGQKPA